MRLTETSRAQHPYARLIPQFLWEKYFLMPLTSSSWERSFDHLMGSSCETDFLSCIEANKAHLDTKKAQVLSLMAVKFPDANVDFINRISTLLHIPPLEKINIYFNLVLPFKGNIETFDLLKEDISSNELQQLLRDHANPLFCDAARNGHIEALVYLREKALVHIREHEAFVAAAEGGQIDALKHLQRLVPTIFTKDRAFVVAAEKGHLSVLKYLEENAPNQLQKMITRLVYKAFREAAANGHLPILRYLEDKAPDKLQEMIAGVDYVAFREAAKNSHLHVLRYLEEKAPNKLQAMIAAWEYKGFEEAVTQGHLDVVKYIAEKAPHQLSSKLFIRLFSAAVRNGHVECIQYLIAAHQKVIANHEKRNNQWGLFSRALNSFLCFIGMRSEPLSLSTLLSNEPMRLALNSARINNHFDTITYLLRYPEIFSLAEHHETEYNRFVIPYIDSYLLSLANRQTQWQDAHTHQDFDIDDEIEAKNLFYMARALIRRKRPVNELNTLLALPSVRALAAKKIDSGRTNALLRLAITLNNTQAITALLAIPEVRQLAEANQFYAEEARGELNLRELAQNRESSMIALSPVEAENIECIKKHYQPQIDSLGGATQVIENFRELLKARYQKKPAKIASNSNWFYRVLSYLGIKNNLTEISLPFSWTAFQQMKLSATQRAEAYKAYYQHIDHTVWRFLEKPNPWMASNASYVQSLPNNQGQYAEFEDYIPLLALLYLAAKDNDSQPIDEYTLEGRIEAFIYELYLAARAHNWDKTRFINGIQEEYDDLQGDKPSCFSGMKRRFFQALKGHILFKILTQETIKQEIKDFVRSYFKDFFIKEASLCHSVWKKTTELEELTEKEREALKKTNILDSQKEAWIDSLRAKHGPKVDFFNIFLTSQFCLKKDECHLLKFSHYFLDRLQATCPLTHKESSSPRVSESPDSLFSRPSHAVLPEEDAYLRPATAAGEAHSI